MSKGWAGQVWLWVVLGALLVVSGLVVSEVTTPDTFGWFAYQPVPDDAWPRVVFPGQLWGFGMAVAGGLLLSGTLGYVLGRRAQPQTSSGAGTKA